VSMYMDSVIQPPVTNHTGEDQQHGPKVNSSLSMYNTACELVDLLALNQVSFSWRSLAMTRRWLSSCLCLSSWSFSISAKLLSCSFFFLLDDCGRGRGGRDRLHPPPFLLPFPIPLFLISPISTSLSPLLFLPHPSHLSSFLPSSLLPLSFPPVPPTFSLFSPPLFVLPSLLPFYSQGHRPMPASLV